MDKRTTIAEGPLQLEVTMRVSRAVLWAWATWALVSFGCGSSNGVESLVVEGTLEATPGGSGLPVLNRGSGPVQLRAIATFEDGTERDVTAEATWAMSDSTGATVEAGVVTPIEPGRNDVEVSFGGVTVTAPFFVLTRSTGVPGINIEGTELGVIQFNGAGDQRQLVATTRLPDGTTLDVSDEVEWVSSDPVAFPVSETGLAEATVSQGASDVTVMWRNRFGLATLQVGDPLPESVEVTVTAVRLAVPFSCDSALTADGREGDFAFEITLIRPDGVRVPFEGTQDYPDPDEAVPIDMGDIYVLGQFTSVGVLDYQAIEVELRVTEWDLQFEDFGDVVPEPDMTDAVVSMIHRGVDNFDAGQNQMEIVGSENCEIRLDYTIGTRR